MRVLTALAAVSIGTLAYGHIVPFPSFNVPVSPTGGSTAAFSLTDSDSVLVYSHTPFPFELSLSMAGAGTAAVTGLVDSHTNIDGALAFTSADHQVWCAGTPAHCTPPYNGTGYYGVQLMLPDGLHYGWVKTNFTNNGFGSLGLSIVRGAYQDVPGQGIVAGAIEGHGLPECESVDFDCDGDTGTDLDIEAFFACLGGGCPAAPCGNNADFNGDGDVGTDADIEAFFRVLGGGSC